VIGASETGPITPIKDVKPGYHDWRYLSPRTDLGFRFVPKDGHDHNDGEDKNEKNKGRRIRSSFGLLGGRRISFSRIYFGLLLRPLRAMIFNNLELNSTSIPFRTAPLLPPALLKRQALFKRIDM